MRYLVMIKTDPANEAEGHPGPAVHAAMARYNEGLARAGVLLAADGLHPSSKGARVTIADGKATVVDGPFTEAKELVAGFWLIQVGSREEAIEWAKRIPQVDQQEVRVELRQVFEDPFPRPVSH